MKLFKIVDTKTHKMMGDVYYESKMEAKKVRNKLEGYKPTPDKDGNIQPHKWKGEYEIKPGVDHWKAN